MTDPVMEALEQTKRAEANAQARRLREQLQAAEKLAYEAPYTVADLRNDLLRLAPGLAVEVEGCDCVGQANGIAVEGNTVLVLRR